MNQLFKSGKPLTEALREAGLEEHLGWKREARIDERRSPAAQADQPAATQDDYWHGYDLVRDMEAARAVIAAGGNPLIVPESVVGPLTDAQLSRLQQEQWEIPQRRIFGRRNDNSVVVIERDTRGRIQSDVLGMNEEHEGVVNRSNRVIGPPTSTTVVPGRARPAPKPLTTLPGQSLTPGGGDLIPLQEYFRRFRQSGPAPLEDYQHHFKPPGRVIGSPSGERTPVEQMIREGARRGGSHHQPARPSRFATTHWRRRRTGSASSRCQRNGRCR